MERYADYLPPGGPDPEDFAKELAANPVPSPDPDDLGTVYVACIDGDHWDASWQRGEEHRDANGSRADVVAWARAQPASRYVILEAGEWVPLLP